ncbi:MAG: DMT family transporter [Alphaproteobacteria bacterium]|nr:DMT family transporter [Alphaproteobacteria bacterium]
MEDLLEDVDSKNEVHNNPLKGMILIGLAVGVLILLEMCAKKATMSGLPVSQVSWIRYAGHLAIFAVLFGPKLKLDIVRTRFPKTQVFRGFLLLYMTLASFMALKHLQMVQVTVIGFLTPLVVAALSVPFLGEKVGIHRWAAIVVGFIGVMFVVRPTGLEMHWSMLYLMSGILAYGFYLIFTRKLAALGENAIRSVFYTALTGGIVLAFVMPFVWEQPKSIEIWFFLAGTAAFGGLGHYLVIKAHEYAFASLLAPFLYTQIVWSTLAGYLQFGDIPDYWTLIGGAIVISSGLYLMMREARKRNIAKKINIEAGKE